MYGLAFTGVQLELLQQAISDAMVRAREQGRERDAEAFNELENLVICQKIGSARDPDGDPTCDAMPRALGCEERFDDSQYFAHQRYP